MFDGMVAQYLERLRPHMLSAQDEWRTWADRVLLGLDAICAHVDAAQLETTDPRKYPNLAVVVATGQELDIVPANEQWLLEAVSFVGAAPATIALRNGGRLLWSRSMALADNQAGNNVVFPGGSIITIDASAAGEVTVQFRRRMPKTHARPNIGGMPVATDPAAPPMDQATILHRHQPAYPQTHPLRKVG